MSKTFDTLGISPKLVAILDSLQFKTPTPIQEQAIPMANKGRDVIGIAQTGTGKTLAFSLPMIQQISKTKKKALIILPTRELADQVQAELNKIGGQLGLKTALLIGGSGIGNQIRQLKMQPHVIIGTPGRINDLLEQRKLVLDNIGVLILDEADRMLDMGFAPQIERIVSRVPKVRQTMLFSATMPREIMRMVNRYLKNPIRVEVSTAGSVTDKVEQHLYVLDRQQKNQLLDKLLSDHEGTVLVFSRTKYGAKKICRAIRDMGHQVAEMHSNLSLAQRRRSLEGFKSGKHRVLVATDIAARGIDVTNIELVVNYDLPDNPDDYVHRVGRTGRAGKIGKAISFATSDQRKELNGIERSVKQRLEITPLPELPPARQSGGPNAYRSSERNFSPGHRRTTFKYAKPGRSKGGQARSQRRKTGRSLARTGQSRARFHT